MATTVYTKPSCVQCNATYRALDSKGIEYDIVDLSEDPAALETVKELGYLQAPVVVTAVSYTHLDVYKRQLQSQVLVSFV